MKAVPYKIINELELALIDNTLSQVVDEWQKSFYPQAEWRLRTESIDRSDRIQADDQGVLYEITTETNYVLAAYLDLDTRKEWISALLPEQETDSAILRDESSDKLSALESQLIEELLLRLVLRCAIALGWNQESASIRCITETDNLSQSIKPGSPVILTHISDHDVGDMTILIPFEIINDFLNASFSAESEQKDQQGPVFESLETAVRSNKVSLEIQLGSLELSIGKLTTLSEGDVIRLEQKLSDPVNVRIGKNKILTGILGAQNGSKAVQIN